jgi:hypothetical protein
MFDFGETWYTPRRGPRVVVGILVLVLIAISIVWPGILKAAMAVLGFAVVVAALALWWIAA